MAESDGGSPARQVASATGRYGTLLFPADDAILGPSLRAYGEWAQREIDLMLDLVPAGGTVLDVGAFIGTHTMAFARHAGGSCRVHAFEPNPWYFELLAHNLDLNDLRNVSTYRVALSDRHQALGFAGEAGRGGNYGHAQLVDADAAAGEIVEATLLDDIELDACDLVKIDVEGMEAEVLGGAGATLEHFRPFVYCECNALEQGWPVIALMRAHGFACWGHCFAAFNPDNFLQNDHNLFGLAREVGLLFVPLERRGDVASIVQDRQRLAAIETLDDLALCLLRKPQFKSEVLAHTAAAAALGTDFFGDETVVAEAADLRAHLARAQGALDEAQALAWSRAAELARLQRQLLETQAAHEFAQQLAHSRAAELADLAGDRGGARAELSAARDALRAAQAETARERETLRVVQSELTANRSELERARTALAEARREPSNRGSHVATLETELAHARDRLDVVHQVAADRERDVVRLSGAVVAARREVEDLRVAYHAVAHSASWRLTAPLRVLRRTVLHWLRRIHGAPRDEINESRRTVDGHD